MKVFCGLPNPEARRSAQTALWHITHALLRLMAPILSFTIEEAWSVFASKEEYEAGGDTIFTQTYYRLPEIADGMELLLKYTQLREIRTEITKQLEEVRITGEIGSSLQAEIEIRASGERYDLLTSLGDDLKFIFITSQAKVFKVGSKAEEGISVRPSTYQKCERCWHYRDDVGSDAQHPQICARCAANLYGDGEARQFA